MTSPAWRKSSRSSGGTGDNCVEVMRLEGQTCEQGGLEEPALRT